MFRILSNISYILKVVLVNINDILNNCYNPHMIRNNLSEIMGRKRINCAELSRISKISYETVHRLYHEKSKGIEFSTLNKLCWALECTPSEIFEYIEDK